MTDPLQVPCPYCEAAPGSRCYRIAAPFRFVATHRQRRDRARMLDAVRRRQVKDPTSGPPGAVGGAASE